MRGGVLGKGILLSSLEAVVQKSDYIVNALPDTPDTRGMLGTQSAQKRAPGSCVISIGGPAVLIAKPPPSASALSSAGIDDSILGEEVPIIQDCFVQQPLPVESGVWESRVLVTPNMAGYLTPRQLAVDFVQKWGQWSRRLARRKRWRIRSIGKRVTSKASQLAGYRSGMLSKARPSVSRRSAAVWPLIIMGYV